MPWRGQLSIPRDLGLIRENGTYWLTQTPVLELAVLRSTVQRVIWLQDKPLTNRIPEDLRNFRSTAFDAELAIDVASLPKVNSEIKLHLRSGNTEPGMVLTWRRTGANTGALSLTRSAAEAGGSTSELKQPEAGFVGKWSSVPFALAQMPIKAAGANNSILKLRILVDRSSVEVFADDGRVVLSSLFFPNSSNREFKPYATGGTAKIVSLVIYPFKEFAASSGEGLKLVGRVRFILGRSSFCLPQILTNFFRKILYLFEQSLHKQLIGVPININRKALLNFKKYRRNVLTQVKPIFIQREYGQESSDCGCWSERCASRSLPAAAR